MCAFRPPCPRVLVWAGDALDRLDCWPGEGGHEGGGEGGIGRVHLDLDAGCLALGNLDRGVAVAGDAGVEAAATVAPGAATGGAGDRRRGLVGRVQVASPARRGMRWAAQDCHVVGLSSPSLFRVLPIGDLGSIYDAGPRYSVVPAAGSSLPLGS